MGILDKATAKVQAELNKRNPPPGQNNATYDNTHSGAHGQGLVPGSHANNPNAIPTAGGQQVGGNTGYSDANVGGMNAAHNNSNINNPNVGGPGYNNAGVHQTAGDKMQNALPGQHGNAHDAHGNPVDLNGPGHNTHSSAHTGSHAGGLTGAHGTHNTHDTHNTYTGPDNRGMMDKAKDAMSSNRSNRPDDPITGTNYDQNNRNTHDIYGHSGTGIAGSNTHHQTGPGFAGSSTHSTHGVHDQHGHNAGPDNRGMMDKAKDVLSSKRSNHPDDPVTGTNYDQNTHNTPNTHSAHFTGGVVGSNNPYHQTGTGIHGNTTHHQPGTAVAGSNVHSTHGTHAAHGNDNRGIMDKAKDLLSSKRSNHPDDPVTGTNYDQKNMDGVHGNAYGQQPGVGGYNAPGSGPAPNY